MSFDIKAIRDSLDKVIVGLTKLRDYFSQELDQKGSLTAEAMSEMHHILAALKFGDEKAGKLVDRAMAAWFDIGLNSFEEHFVRVCEQAGDFPTGVQPKQYADREPYSRLNFGIDFAHDYIRGEYCGGHTIEFALRLAALYSRLEKLHAAAGNNPHMIEYLRGSVTYFLEWASNGSPLLLATLKEKFDLKNPSA